VNESAQKVLDYWFGEIENGFPKENRNQLWFAGGKQVDDDIQEHFEPLVKSASKGKLSNWEATPQERIALIILLDQFTRNLFRGSEEAFAYDIQAQSICLTGIELGHDQELPHIMRLFFYMPLEHSESRELHQKGMSLFTAMSEEIHKDHETTYQSFLDSVDEHKKIVDQFGRYPHRNKSLGRVSTPEEIEYLSGDHKSFGQ